MIDFEKEKQKRDRGANVDEVIASALGQAEDIESVVIVSRHKNGNISTSYSWDSSVEALGMLEVSKIYITDMMRKI